MKKKWYLAACVSTIMQAAIDIDNRSLYPFTIKSITYQHTNGLHKTPSIDLSTKIIAANSQSALQPENREPIIHLSGIHNNKNYAFDFPPGIQGTLFITKDNQVKLIGPRFFEEKSIIDFEKPKDFRGIRRL